MNEGPEVAFLLLSMPMNILGGVASLQVVWQSFGLLQLLKSFNLEMLNASLPFQSRKSLPITRKWNFVTKISTLCWHSFISQQ
jgi:hypothetical protein